jgi:hypothetical protein
MNSILKLNVVIEYMGFFILPNQEMVRMLFLFSSCYADIMKTMLPDLLYTKDVSDQG